MKVNTPPHTHMLDVHHSPVKQTVFNSENHPRGHKIVVWIGKGGRHELPCIQSTSRGGSKD